MTITEMFKHYLPLRKVKDKKTDQRYAADWTQRFGPLELDELSTARLIEWRDSRLKEVEARSVNLEFNHLSAFYELAIQDRFCFSNPTTNAKAPEEEKKPRCRLLELFEEEALAEELGPVKFFLVLFALLTGLEQKEQFELEWTEVDLASRFMSPGNRRIPINKRLLPELERRKLIAKSKWVFPYREGPMNGPNFCARDFRPALKKAEVKLPDGSVKIGIEDFTWADLRLTFAGRLATAGVQMHLIAELLGQDVANVAQRFKHLCPDTTEQAVARL